MFRLLIISLVFCCVNYSYAQTKEGMLLNFSQENGLPSDEAYCVFKDSKGYIWIATDQGVVRHKGGAMEVIKGLPDNVVFKIKEDSKGRVWFFSRRNRLAYYENGKVRPFIHNDSIQIKMGRHLVTDAYISHDDNIHINTQGTSKFIINISNGSIKESRYLYDDYMRACIMNISSNDDVDLWTEKQSTGIAVYNLLVVNLIDHNDTVKYSISSGQQRMFRFYGACRIKTRDIVFFCGKYLIKFFQTGGYSIKEFDDEILTMKYDERSNVVVVGVRTKGAYRVDADDLHITRDKNLETLNSKSITGVTYDDEGGEWFSTLENGIYYNKSPRISKLLENKVSRIYYYKDSILLFASNSGIYQVTEDNVAPVVTTRSENVLDIKEDKEGNLFVAATLRTTESEGFPRRFDFSLAGNSGKHLYQLFLDDAIIFKDDTTFLFCAGGFLHAAVMDYNKNDYFRNIYRARLPQLGKLYKNNSGDIWFCGLTAFFKYDTSARKFNTVDDPTGLLSKGTIFMCQLTADLYAVGIASSGLVLLRDDKVIAQITDNDGLLGNSIRNMLVTGNKLWLGMSNGISVIEFSSYDPPRYKITNFGNNISVGDLVIHQLLPHKASITIATNKGIYELNDVDNLLRQSPQPIPLYITRLNYYKGDTTAVSSITLPYKHNQLTIDFDALCYNASSELKYYYRLIDGSDTGWRSLQTSQIVLANLTPGNYKLQIKVELPKYKRYSAIQELEITIEKPWWQWNIVRIGTLLLFLFIVYLIYNRRVKIITKREEEKTFLQTEMAELKQVALRSQMNPHFIFNCLTSIQQLVVAGNRDEANEYLVKFSRLIRKTLELSIRSHISLAEEKEYISEYLELEQLRIPGQFDFYFNIAKDINTDTTEISNMMLQPIVENCVRHGIKHLENRKGMIQIDVSRADGYLYCEVTDNGVGRQAKSSGRIFSSSRSFGMGIIEKRLTGLAGYDRGNYFIKLIDKTDDKGIPAGTKVILQLPFKVRTL